MRDRLERDGDGVWPRAGQANDPGNLENTIHRRVRAQGGGSMMPIAEPRTDPARSWDLTGPRVAVTARRIVDQECRRIGLAESLVDDAVQAVDELAANAVLHGSAPYELRLYTDPLGWGVVDHADAEAVIRSCLSAVGEASPVVDELALCEAGRGLPLVAGLFPGTCCVRAAVDRWGHTAKEVVFAMTEAGVHAVEDADTCDGPGMSPSLARVGQRVR